MCRRCFRCIRRDWHERETYDFFGIVFDGHPGLTRIEMPDDCGPSAAQGLSAGWCSGRVPRRPDPAARRTQVLPLMSEHIIDGGDGVIVLGGQDWDEIVAAARQGEAGERIVVNMGPQHPSTTACCG